jgi:hypothetical protein
MPPARLKARRRRGRRVKHRLRMTERQDGRVSDDCQGQRRVTCSGGVKRTSSYGAESTNSERQRDLRSAITSDTESLGVKTIGDNGAKE